MGKIKGTTLKAHIDKDGDLLIRDADGDEILVWKGELPALRDWLNEVCPVDSGDPNRPASQREINDSFTAELNAHADRLDKLEARASILEEQSGSAHKTLDEYLPRLFAVEKNLSTLEAKPEVSPVFEVGDEVEVIDSPHTNFPVGRKFVIGRLDANQGGEFAVPEGESSEFIYTRRLRKLPTQDTAEPETVDLLEAMKALRDDPTLEAVLPGEALALRIDDAGIYHQCSLHRWATYGIDKSAAIARYTLRKRTDRGGE